MADQTGAGGGTTGGWYPDPQGRYEQRYFDGVAWTSHVSTGGTVTTDGGGAGPPGPSGASLYGTPTTPYGIGGPIGGGPGWRTPTRYENRVGWGLVVYLVGLLLVGVSLALPWLDGRGPFDLDVVNASGRTSAALSEQLASAMIWAVLWLFLTCLPLQPGKLLGFLGGGCIGLIVCWHPLDKDSPSKRSNALGVFVLLVHLIVLWLVFASVRSDYIVESAAIGLGPVVLTVGYLVMIVGAAMGRQRVRVG